MHRGRRFAPKFYGSTTLGEKGQVVIPAEARTALDLAKGEKMLVFGMGGDSLMLSKVTNLERRAAHLSHRLESLQSMLESASEEPAEEKPVKKKAASKKADSKKPKKK